MVVNAVGLALLYLVRLDVIWRTSACATDAFTPCRAPISSVAFYPFTMVTTVPWYEFPLRSPLTLDWTQLLIFALVVFDIVFAYRAVRDRTKPPTAP